MKILVGGSVAIDNVKTPTAEEKNLLGGSASYAALAASKLALPVHLIGIVGHDFPADHLEMLESNGVNLSALERSEEASFTWTGEYHENMNDRTTHDVAINVLEHWTVKVPSELQDADYVLQANMAPANQLQMLDQCQAKKKFVLADTMDLWIDIANDELHEVLTSDNLTPHVTTTLTVDESEKFLMETESGLQGLDRARVAETTTSIDNLTDKMFADMEKEHIDHSNQLMKLIRICHPQTSERREHRYIGVCHNTSFHCCADAVEGFILGCYC